MRLRTRCWNTLLEYSEPQSVTIPEDPRKRETIVIRSRLTSALVLLLLLQSGCSFISGDDGYFRDRKNDYLKAKVYPPISVSETLDDSTIDSLYVIPVSDSEAHTPSSFEVPRPVPLSTSSDKDSVLIQKLGDKQWILVNVNPSNLWPQLKYFLVKNKIGIEEEDGTSGVIETAWLIPQGSDKREKYRFVVEQGLQRNMSEVHIEHIERDTKMDFAKEWSDYKGSEERRNWMIDELATFVASGANTGSVSLLAQGISTANKLTMAKSPQGYPVIILRLPFNRSWASMQRALEKSQFEIEDMDRSKGVYYVRFTPKVSDEEDKPGFWGRVFRDDDEEALLDTDYAGENYQLKVAESDEGVRVSLHQDAEAEFSAVESEKLLNVIKGNLL